MCRSASSSPKCLETRLTDLAYYRRRMSAQRAFTLTPRRRRNFITTLFALTFVASVVTVSASAVLPCPAGHGRLADSPHEGETPRRVTVEKRPRRWIEERSPGA